MTSENFYGSTAHLCAYTDEVLMQVANIVRPYIGLRQPLYKEEVGAHIRHIIEHYGTLYQVLSNSRCANNSACVVDYDARERNTHIESNPQLALDSIDLLQGALTAIDCSRMTCPVQVHIRGGTQGEHNFSTRSSVARELMFLNSHTTHHFATLQAYAHQRGESLGAGLGKAPATVAHEKRFLESTTGAQA